MKKYYKNKPFRAFLGGKFKKMIFFSARLREKFREVLENFSSSTLKNIEKKSFDGDRAEVIVNLFSLYYTRSHRERSA